MFFSPWPANLKFDLSNDSCQLLSPLSGIPLAASVCQQNNCHQLRLSGAQVNAQQRPVDYARKVGEGQPELSPIFDVCTKQPAVSPQDWPRRTAAAVRECSNRPRYIITNIIIIYICVCVHECTLPPYPTEATHIEEVSKKPRDSDASILDDDEVHLMYESLKEALSKAVAKVKV